MTYSNPEIVREEKMTAHLYQVDNKEWVVADQAGWLPGTWATRDEALAAVRKANGLT